VKLTRGNVFNFVNAHFFVVAVLAVLNLVFLTRLVLAWNTLRNDRPEQIQEYQANLKTLEFQTAPLRGLPAKVDSSEKQALKFYGNRMPSNYSSISAELFHLEQKENVRVVRVSYPHKAALPGLEEVDLDVSLTGEYAPIMRFINGLERDKLFFVINGLTLTGQQGGNVNVRLRLTTYIHADNAEDMTAPPDTGAADDTSPTASLTRPGSSEMPQANGGQ
jgi:type IV pilus assembly protein PilO